MAPPMENFNVERTHRLECEDLMARKFTVFETIVQRLRNSRLDNYSLGTGRVGCALFFFEVYKRLGRPEDLEQARDELGCILEGASELHDFDLYQGLAGVGWLLHHFKTLDTSNELQLAPDCCADVDDILIELAGSPGWQHHYDLISGLVGIGVYALSHPDLGVGARLFGCVIDRLVETSESDQCGTSWRTPTRLLPSVDERMRYPNGNFNLGIAHGIPGVIALLGKGLSKGYDTDRCASLLRRSVSWLLATSSVSEAPFGVPSFGYHVGDGIQARTAWCYGDLSVAIALFCASRGLDDEQLFGTAIRIATSTLDRSETISCVHDASLCHGSQGNAHIYRRLFQWTKLQRFSEACSHWESATVAPSMLSPESSNGAFLPFKFLDEWKQDNGYLMGLSGIGLSLADGLYGLSNSWDTPMMTGF
jgi:lantibiotic biosynthesis protein